MDALRQATEGHRILWPHRCACGWEGDDAITHIIDLLHLTETPESANNAMVKYETPWIARAGLSHD